MWDADEHWDKSDFVPIAVAVAAIAGPAAPAPALDAGVAPPAPGLRPVIVVDLWIFVFARPLSQVVAILRALGKRRWCGFFFLARAH